MSSKRYSKEFKINAVRQYLETGKSQESIMKEFGVGDRVTFSGWVKEYKSKGDQAFDKKVKLSKKNANNLTSEEELIMLRAENEMLKKILEWQRGNVQRK